MRAHRAQSNGCARTGRNPTDARAQGAFKIYKLGSPFRSGLPTIAATRFQQTTEHNVLEHDSQDSIGFWPPIRIVASRQRRRTVAARLRSGVLELLVPS